MNQVLFVTVVSNYLNFATFDLYMRCTEHEKVRDTYKMLLGKPAGKRSGGRQG
jgi:hypothetical protein